MADTTGIFVSSDGQNWSEYRGQGILDSVTADRLTPSTNYEVYGYYNDGNREISSEKKRFRTLWSVTKTDERVSVDNHAYPTIYTRYTASDTISSVAYTFGGSTVNATFISPDWVAEVQREATTGQSNSFSITLTSAAGDTTVLTSSFTPQTDSVTIGAPTVSQVDWMTFNVYASVSPTASHQTYATKSALLKWKNTLSQWDAQMEYINAGSTLSASGVRVADSGYTYEFTSDLSHYGNHHHYSPVTSVYVPRWLPDWKESGSDYIDLAVHLAPDFDTDVILHVYDSERLDNEVFRAGISQSGEGLTVDNLSANTVYYFQCVSKNELIGEVYTAATTI